MRDLRLILNFRTILFCTGIFWDWKEAQAIVPYVLIYFSPWNIYSINWLLLKPWKLYGTLFLLESIYVALCSFSLVTGEWLCIFLIRQYYRILVPRHIPCIAKDKVRAELLVCEWYKYLRCIWTFLFLEFLKPLYLFQKGKREPEEWIKGVFYFKFENLNFVLSLLRGITRCFCHDSPFRVLRLHYSAVCRRNQEKNLFFLPFSFQWKTLTAIWGKVGDRNETVLVQSATEQSPFLAIDMFFKKWILPEITSCPVTEHQWPEPDSIFFASSFQVFIDVDQIPLWAFSYLGCSVLALSTSPHRRATPDPSFYLLFAGVSVPPGLLGSPVFNREGWPLMLATLGLIQLRMPLTFFLSAMNIVMHINYFWKSLFGKCLHASGHRSNS